MGQNLYESNSLVFQGAQFKQAQARYKTTHKVYLKSDLNQLIQRLDSDQTPVLTMFLYKCHF